MDRTSRGQLVLVDKPAEYTVRPNPGLFSTRRSGIRAKHRRLVSVPFRHQHQVVLDVRDLDFMDSVGLHAILSMANRLGLDSCVVLVGAHGIVARVIDILRIGDETKVEVVPC